MFLPARNHIQGWMTDLNMLLSCFREKMSGWGRREGPKAAREQNLRSGKRRGDTSLAGTSQLLREQANYSETSLAGTSQLLVGSFPFHCLIKKKNFPANAISGKRRSY